MAVARLGITVREFAKMTPKEFSYALEAKNKEQENKEVSAYERLRILITKQMNMSGKSVKREVKPEEIMKFPWDTKKQSPEEMKRQVLNIAAAFGAKKK